MRVSLFNILVFLMALCVLPGCENTGESEGYFFEDEADEEYYDEDQPVAIPENVELQSPLEGEASTVEKTPEFDPDTVKDFQDDEPAPTTVKDLIAVNVTDGKIDSAKLTASIVNTLMYVSKQPLGPSFTCEQIAYIGNTILIPIKKNETFSSVYIPRDFAGKRYHFMLLNFRGRVSGKNYIVECKRNDFNYKELFVFYPEAKTRTQTSLLLAIADEYLKDVETMVNINWRTGEEDAEAKDYGVVQFLLKKKIPDFN